MAHILVVDDQASMAALLAAVLTAEGYSVATAASAAEAWPLIEETPPDLVISDVRMPITNGFQLIRDIRAHYPDMKCILMSGDADFGAGELVNETRRLKIAATLEKPFQMTSFLGIVEGVLAGKIAPESAGE